jgi:UDP-N-acetylglucosamine transferase subunit ALG13
MGVDATQGSVANVLRKKAATLIASAETYRQKLVDDHAKALAQADELLAEARAELRRIDTMLAKAEP